MTDTKVLELIEKLISYDTTSRNSNLDIIKFIEDYFKTFYFFILRLRKNLSYI